MAKIKQINLDPNERPTDIVIQLTAREAIYLAKMLGKQNSYAAADIMPNGDVYGSEVYSALTSGVFNKFYEDGIKEAERYVAPRDHDEVA